MRFYQETDTKCERENEDLQFYSISSDSQNYNDIIKFEFTSYSEDTNILLLKILEDNNSKTTKEINCDNSCEKMKDNLNAKCLFLSYPVRSNFTFNIYADNNCQYQKSLVLDQAYQPCWKINQNFSISPYKFNNHNFKELSVNLYNNSFCSDEEFIGNQLIICDNSCFNINGLEESFTCKFMNSYSVKINYFLFITIFIFFL